MAPEPQVQAAVQSEEARPPLVETYAFDAFLSYSARADYDSVRRMESFLESFHTLKTPRELPLKKLEICTDVSDFRLPPRSQRPASPTDVPSIAAVLDQHLAQSRYLVVLCCPEAVGSQWVDYEVRWFLEHRSREDILLAVTGGADPANQPEEVFPAAIREERLHLQASWYDLRGIRPRGQRGSWIRVKDLEEQQVRLAADLQGYSAGELQPLWFREQTRRARRRNFIAAAVMLAIAGLAIAAVAGFFRAREERDEANRNLAEALIQKGAKAEAAQRWNDARLYYSAALQTSPSVAARRALYTPLAQQPRLLHRWTSSVSFMASQAIDSRDGGQLLAAGTGVRIWDLRSGKLIRSIRPNDFESFTAIALSPQREHLWISSPTGALKLLEAGSGRVLFNHPPAHEALISTIAISENGQVAATAHRDGWITLRDPETGRPLRSWTTGDTLRGITLTPGGELLASVSESAGLQLWDTRTGLEVASPQVPNAMAVQFDRGAKRLVSLDAKGQVSVWALETGQPVRALPARKGSTALGVSSRSELAVVDEQGVALWNIEEGKKVGGIRRSGPAPESMLFTPSGELVVRTRQGMEVWEPRSGAGRRLNGHAGGVEAVTFSADGALIASGGEDGTVRLLAAATGEELKVLDVGAAVRAVAFVPDGRQLASGDVEERVLLWDLKTGGSVEVPFKQHGPVRAVAFSDDGTYLAVAMGELPLQLWDLRRGQATEVPEIHNANAVAFAPGAHAQVLAGDDDNSLQLYDLDRKALLWRKPGAHFNSVRTVGFLPGGRQVVSGGLGGLVKLWRSSDGQLLRTLGKGYDQSSGPAADADGAGTQEAPATLWGRFMGPEVNSIATSAQGPWVAAVMQCFDQQGGACPEGAGNELLIWNPRVETRALAAAVHPEGALVVAFSPGGTRLATAGRDGSVRLWELVQPEVRPGWRHGGNVVGVAFVGDGKVVSAGEDGTLAAWHQGDPSELMRYQLDASGSSQEAAKEEDEHPKGFSALALSADRSEAVLGTSRGEVRLVRLGTMETLRRLSAGSAPIVGVARLSSEPSVVAASLDGQLSSWDAHLDKPKVFRAEGTTLHSLSASSEGNHIYLGAGDGTVRRWVRGSASVQTVFAGHNGPIRALAISRDERVALSGGADGTLRLWRIEDGSELWVRLTPVERVDGVALSPDGSLAASVGGDNKVRLWDAATGEEVRTLEGHEPLFPVLSVGFSPDGQWLASAGADETVRLWPLHREIFSESGEVLHQQARHETGLSLSDMNAILTPARCDLLPIRLE